MAASHHPKEGCPSMDLPVLVIVYCAAAAVVLFFLLTALRGARRVDEQQDRELIASLTDRRDKLARQAEPLPPLRSGTTDDALPAMSEQQATHHPPA